MNLKQRAFRGAIWATVQSWGVRLLAFAVFAYLARTIPPQAFGIVALGAVFISVIDGTLVQSFPEALVRHKSIDPEHLDVCFWLTVGFGCVAAVAIYLLSGVAATIFREPQVRPVLQWLALGIPVGALGRVHEALLRRELQFRRLAVRSLITAIISSAIAVWLAVAGFAVWALVGKTLVEAICGSAILWLSYPWRPRFQFSRTHLHDLKSFGLNLSATRVVGFISQRVDTIIIGRSLGPTQLGQYTIGQRLSEFLMETLHQSISNVAIPTFAAIQDQHTRLQAAYVRTIRFTAFIAMPVFATVAVLAQELVQVLFGPQWYGAVAVLRIFAAGGTIFSFTYFVSPLLLAKGHANWFLHLVTLNAVLGVIAFGIASSWGIVAVAATYVVRGLIASIVSLLVVQRAIGIGLRDTVRTVGGSAMLTLLLAAVLLLISESGIVTGPALWKLIALGSLAAGIYLLLARLFAPKLLEEIFGTLAEFAPRLARLFQPIRTPK